MSNLDPKIQPNDKFYFDADVPDNEFFMAPKQRVTVNLSDTALAGRRGMGVLRGEEVIEALEGEVDVGDIVF